MLFSRSLTTAAIGSILAFAGIASAQTQSAFQVDCPEPNASNAGANSNAVQAVDTYSSAFEDYINALLASLHTAGLTNFEELIAEFSEISEGFDVLEDVWANVGSGQDPNGGWSVIAPTNDAFSKASLSAPFTSLSADQLYALFTYHIVTSPISTTTTSVVDTLFTPAITSASSDSAIVASTGGVKLNLKNGLAQGGSLSIVGSTNATGLTIYSVDKVLTPPSGLVSTLTSSGLNLYEAALNKTASTKILESLDVLTSTRGLTVFAPQNSAFNGNMTSQVSSNWLKVLNGHYSSASTLYSSDFNSTTKLFMSTGNPVTFTTNSSGTFVVASDGTSAKIIQSDIVLENGGVIHIVDSLLSASSLYAGNNTQAYVSGALPTTTFASLSTLLVAICVAGLAMAI